MSLNIKDETILDNEISEENKSKADKNFRKQYNDLINQLEMKDIVINKASFETLDYDYVPSDKRTEVKWRTSASYKNMENELRVFQRYNVTISDFKEKAAKAKLTFVFLIVYQSKINMDDKYFDIFKGVNLTLNTWPYFREFVHDSVTRMGWPPFIAPLYKA